MGGTGAALITQGPVDRGERDAAFSKRGAPHAHHKLVAQSLGSGPRAVFNAGAMTFAQLAANVQAKPGAAAARAEEGFEQVALDFGRYRRTVAEHGQGGPRLVARCQPQKDRTPGPAPRGGWRYRASSRAHGAGVRDRRARQSMRSASRLASDPQGRRGCWPVVPFGPNRQPPRTPRHLRRCCAPARGQRVRAPSRRRRAA
jgi:hypothetical protein